MVCQFENPIAVDGLRGHWENPLLFPFLKVVKFGVAGRDRRQYDVSDTQLLQFLRSRIDVNLYVIVRRRVRAFSEDDLIIGADMKLNMGVSVVEDPAPPFRIKHFHRSQIRHVVNTIKHIQSQCL